jgi:hypothetical protein
VLPRRQELIGWRRVAVPGGRRLLVRIDLPRGHVVDGAGPGSCEVRVGDLVAQVVRGAGAAAASASGPSGPLGPSDSPGGGLGTGHLPERARGLDG